jgi:hypothetical protein
MRALQRHQARKNADAENARDTWHHSGFVLTNSFGGAIEPRNPSATLPAFLKRAHPPHIRVHDLCHSCTTLLLHQGVEFNVVELELSAAATSTWWCG